ncbi:cupin domain-containing protein [Nitrogeniibacter aestuarii]|uniref:cupin domain-containing protein n=1 Tax=Nitrogeniibacter aestuarii TaxID=2815343 RepID=UPI001E56CC04|nr:cupin domain-containing protein [Nitrogeniibacter aestuarii]
MTQTLTKTGRHFAQMEAGPMNQWPDYTVHLPGLDIPGKLFIKETLGLTGCEISINAMPPGGEVPFYHTHKQNEEVYIFIKGRGQLQIDGETLDVKEGSIVRIAPDAERIWRNNGDESLVYIIMQVKENSLVQWSAVDGNILETAPAWG